MFFDASKMALYAKQLSVANDRLAINIIASHTVDDDAMAYAKYKQYILHGLKQLNVDSIKDGIRNARSEQKTFRNCEN